jgi:tRNA nucleotidyltransferase (CCA-adding enzyme)
VPQPRRQPAPAPAPPSVSQVAAGQDVAPGGASALVLPPAAGAAGGAVGAGVAGATAAGAVVAGLAGEAAIAYGTKQIVDGLLRLFRRKIPLDVLYVITALQRQHPGIPAADMEGIRQAELERERVFQAKTVKRWQEMLPKLLAIPNPQERAEAVRKFRERERQIMQARQHAMLERGEAAIERTTLRVLSPSGAYWALSPHVKAHTLDCLVMGGKFHPWKVLDEIHPPLHHGCPCMLFGLDEALQRGLITVADVPSDPDAALRKARTDIARARKLMEAVSSEQYGLWAASRDGENLPAPDRAVDLVLSALVEEAALPTEPVALAEADYADRLHPRDRVGRWIRGFGFPSYKVGGTVRDKLMGRHPKDDDFVVMAHPDQIRAAVEKGGGHAEDLIVRDRVVGIRAHKEGVTPPEGVEIAPPRVEVSTGESRHDFVIEPHPAVMPGAAQPTGDPIADDSKRRDFTVNALYEDTTTGEVVDPTGTGREDLEAGLLRTTSPDSFTEDPLRMLRATRFMSTHGFTLHPATRERMVASAPQLDVMTSGGVSGTAVTELNKTLMGDHVGAALREMRDTGTLQTFLPELAPTVGFDQESRYHDLSLDEHIISVVENAAALGAPLEVRLAALFHDAGKPEAAFRGEDGRLHYYGDPATGTPDHAEAGARIAHEALTRLNYPEGVRARVERLVRHHMIPPMDTRKPARVRRWRAEVGADLVEDLLIHRRADITAKGEPEPAYVESLERFSELARANAEAPAARSDLAVGGRDLIAAGVPPGPQMGVLLDDLLHQVIADPSLNRKEWLLAEILRRYPPDVPETDDLMQEAERYAERQHPRGRTGEWVKKLGTPVHRPEAASEVVEAKDWSDPPPPVGKKGESKGGKGYSSDAAFGTNTALGHVGEDAFVRILGGEILHPEGKGAQSPLDVRYDGYGFEVKAVSTRTLGYKATPKPHEIEQKEAHAKELGLQAALAIVVIDSETGRAHAYFREGLKGGRLSKNTGWRYLGSTDLETSTVGSAESKLQEALAEAEFEHLHPRGRLGRFVEKLGDRLEYREHHHSEASNIGGKIVVGRKFLDLPERTQDFVVAHELGHDLDDALLLDPKTQWVWDAEQWKDAEGMPLGGPTARPGERIADAYAVAYTGGVGDAKRWPAILRVAAEARERGLPIHPDIERMLMPEPEAPAGHAGAKLAVGYAQAAQMVADGFAGKAQRAADEGLANLDQWLASGGQDELDLGTVKVSAVEWDTGQRRAIITSSFLNHPHNTATGAYLSDPDVADVIRRGTQELVDKFKASTLDTQRKQLRGKIAADKGVDGKRAYKAVREALAENDGLPSYAGLRDRFPGVHDSVVLIDQKGYGTTGLGVDDVFVTASRKLDLDLTAVNAVAMTVHQRLSEEMPGYLTGEHGPHSVKPGAGHVTTRNPAGVLRHEWAHGLWDDLSDGQRAEFIAMLPDWDGIAAGLSQYAAGDTESREKYARFVNPDKGGYYTETFAEAVALTTGPYFTPADWPEWVRDAAGWIDRLGPE